MATTMDDVLDILHRTGPEFGGGLANHGPMAAEAMLALGRPDAVLSWVARYKRRLQDRPAHLGGRALSACGGLARLPGGGRTITVAGYTIRGIGMP
jgi:hypothetical protein